MKMVVNEFEVKSFTFPDGQPHVDLRGLEPSTDYSITCSIRNSEELMNLMLVHSILMDNIRPQELRLNIAYLLGARMDRPISFNQPFTMKVIADIINSVWFSEINVFHAHSSVAINLLRANNILPFDQFKWVRSQNRDARIIAPDKGSVDWICRMTGSYTVCEKVRDPYTGKLSGFKVKNPEEVIDRDCLIIDDICDGGGTFTGLAEELKRCGAKKISLYVSHGIFSKGFNLPGIDKIYTTDSYRDSYPPEISVLKAF